MTQNEADLVVSTGGLSFLGSAGARMIIEVVVTLPKDSGDVTVNALSLPIIVESVPRGRDIVLINQSSSIVVHNIEARSLTVQTQSGDITFEKTGRQQVDEFVVVNSSSGSTKLFSTILTPKLHVDNKSGSTSMYVTTDTKDLAITSKSGTITTEVDYLGSEHGTSIYQNISGSIRAQMRRWEGFLTVKSGSGSSQVKGDNLNNTNGGWQRGTGDAKASFSTRSGSVNVLVV